ncbi:MAG: glycosyltransferase family 4 protein [Anaerolineae bacterium]|nr:glycosyltransferase family 4 protein [Anaerolineae bacterium]
MRVLRMVSSLAMGGAERNLVSVLPYLRDAGVTPLLCTLNTRRDSSLVEDLAKTGVRRIDLGAKRMTDPAAWQRFTEVLRDEQIDILHVEGQDPNIYGALARWRVKTPAVMTRHVMVEPAPDVKKFVRARLVFIAAKYGLDRIIAVSEVVRQHFAKQAGIPLSKIETIYNGIQLERFDTRATRDSKRAEMGWQSDDLVVSMVAVLRPGKGHEVLFQAIPQIKASVPNVRIKLIGSGELEGEFRQQAAPFADVVEFLGERKDVPELLGASDALVLPSWSEALPTVLIEAGAAALPVVATNVGGSGEIVENGKGGYLVPAGDSAQLGHRLIEVLQNPALARQMGETAHERVVRLFSLQRQAQQTIALYEKVIANR